jgi:uncharacterized protein YkwD
MRIKLGLLIIWSGWQCCSLGCQSTLTVNQVHRLSDLEQSVVNELNLARTRPQVYIEFLEARRPHYDGRYYSPSGEIMVETKEGVTAVDEAIAYLKKMKPTPALTLSDGMSRGARDHVQDQGPRGTLGHAGSDGSQPWDRITRYGIWQKTVGENISYGEKNARDIVLSLIIDDGVPGRGHRLNVYNPAFRKIGVACGYHQEYRLMCVTTLAGDYTEKPK